MIYVQKKLDSVMICACGVLRLKLIRNVVSTFNLHTFALQRITARTPLFVCIFNLYMASDANL